MKRKFGAIDCFDLRGPFEAKTEPKFTKAKKLRKAKKCDDSKTVEPAPVKFSCFNVLAKRNSRNFRATEQRQPLTVTSTSSLILPSSNVCTLNDALDVASFDSLKFDEDFDSSVDFRQDLLRPLLENAGPHLFQDSCLLADPLLMVPAATDSGNQAEEAQTDYTILETFEDVSAVEVSKVRHLKTLLKETYAKYWRDYYQVDREISFPSDVCGDVKLLRTLRLCSGNVDKTVDEVKKFLTWRKEYDIEDIRSLLIEKNYSLEELRERVVIRDRHLFFPLFAQDACGDFIDVYGLSPKAENYVALIPDYFRTYATICEFKSIVLDRLSRLQRRVIKVSIVINGSVVTDSQPLQQPPDRNQSSTGDWWKAIKLWGWFLEQNFTMHYRWYGGTIRNLYFLDVGGFSKRILKVITSLYLRKFNGEIDVLDTPEGKVRVLQDSIGERNRWPRCVGGGCADPVISEVSNKRLSKLRTIDPLCTGA